jgi:transitional endoplasmic reticulum ATPase
LLHGPPGVGKTLLVRALAAEAATVLAPFAVRVFTINGPAIVSPVVGRSEQALRAVFERAAAFACGGALGDADDNTGGAGGLAIIFMDEMDAICPRRATPGARIAAGGGGHSDPVLSRIVTQLLTLMDGALVQGAAGGSGGAAARGHVIVIGATNRPDALDPALRRPGRFDREVRIDPPAAPARLAILRLHARGLPLSPLAAAALPAVAERAVGYVGADLAAVCREAATLALQRALRGSLPPAWRDPELALSSDSAPCEELVTPDDLETALRLVGASSLRGLTPQHERTAWADIGGMGSVVAQLQAAVVGPLSPERAALYRRMGLSMPRGLLLYGPPGNSKTTLVRALATAVHASFFALAGADVYSPFVGDAERTLRTVFARAREAVPSLIFLDEIDAMVGKRGIGGAGGGGHDVSTSVLATLLAEMDGVQSADGVLVVGATNRPGALDPALLRPGRLELHIHVPLPDAAGRAAILRVHTRACTLEAGVDLDLLSAGTPGWSGARLENLCREAGMAALRRRGLSAPAIAHADFVAALARLQTSA